ncbi:MAG: hypothetical protein RIS29_3376 [Bacteroidota bacterium]|jgi:hypothetical protein
MYNMLYRKNKLPINNTPLRIEYAHNLYKFISNTQFSGYNKKAATSTCSCFIYIDIRNKLFLFNINHQI